jgi:hypothetical protein
VSFDFAFQDGRPCNATIQDMRSNAGSKTLEQLGIVGQIEDAIMGAFNGGNIAAKGRFRSVFGSSSRYVTIYVGNPVDYYDGPEAPSRYVMNLHIDYLKSSPADIEQKIRDAVTAMNGMTS